MDPALKKHLRTLLILGRTSNLPTVWSNCLAGWWLGGGNKDSVVILLWLCFSTTLLYVGGMFLNDAFDAQFDRQHRPERPIPSGLIPMHEVWQWGIGLILLGMLFLVFLSKTTAILTLLLVGSIVLYDAVHKMVTFAPVLMAACRFFLYLVAASVAPKGVTGWAVWMAFALAAYIIGLSYLARKEGSRMTVSWWPCLLLMSPIGLAFLVNTGTFQSNAFIYSLLLALWIIFCLRYTFTREQRNIGYTVSGLLAGIVLVDLLAVAGGNAWLTVVFIVLFIAARLCQRMIPAT